MVFRNMHKRGIKEVTPTHGAPLIMVQIPIILTYPVALVNESMVVPGWCKFITYMYPHTKNTGRNQNSDKTLADKKSSKKRWRTACKGRARN